MKLLIALILLGTLVGCSPGGEPLTWTLAVIVGLVVVVTWMLLAKMMSLLRERLREHERTEEALRETERGLPHSQKMQALGTLVGGIAHDFNNLLTAILGNAEMLRTKLAANDPRNSHAQEIEKAGARAAALTRQLLAFSRFDMVELRSVDFNRIVRETGRLLKRSIPETIDLSLECGDDIGSVLADPVQIEQVLVNLVTNARDAVSDGGTVIIRTRKAEVTREDAGSLGVSPGLYCRLTVEDDGCGIGPEMRSRVFDPFFTTKERSKGTGLGLSTVHGFVKRSKGFLVVNREPGEGSRFDVYLPRREETAARDTSSLPAGTETFAGSETILVVEDDDQVRIESNP